MSSMSVLFETATIGFEPGTMDFKIASLTLFTCSSRSLTFILRSSFFSRSLDSSVDRVDNFCFRFWRHLLEARLFRSLMRRYFWSPEQPGSPLVMDDSEVMLKLEETLRHLALKIEQKFHFKHIIKGPFINDVMQIWPQNCVVQKWLQKSGYSPPPKLCNVVFNVSYNEFKRWIKIHFPPMGKFSIWLW